MQKSFYLLVLMADDWKDILYVIDSFYSCTCVFYSKKCNNKTCMIANNTTIHQRSNDEYVRNYRLPYDHQQ